MKIRSILISAVVTSSGFVGLVAAAAPANATTTDCDYTHGSNYGSVYCYTDSSGTQFRSAVKCRLDLTDGPAYTTVYGGWETQGDRLWSLGQCSSGGWYYYSETAQLK